MGDDDREQLGEVLDLTWQQYEHLVKHHLQEVARGPVAVTVHGKRDLVGASGEFEIDATAEFEVMGMAFVVVVEANNHRRRVGRDVIMALWAKLQELAGHKGAVFSTSGFQSGAIEYAAAKGIALVQLTPTGMTMVRKGAQNDLHGTPVCVAQLVRTTKPGVKHVTTDHPSAPLGLAIALGTTWLEEIVSGKPPR